MSLSIKEIDSLLHNKEDEHLEFKLAKNGFHFDELVKYCVALANERGGKIIFGVTDKRPRKIAGTTAFPELERTKIGLNQRIPLRIEVEEVLHPEGRVVIFTIPSRPIGMPIHYEGRYYMRAGESLVPMSQDVLKQIFNETSPDYTADICSNAEMSDLDIDAIEDFRNRWIQKSKNENIRNLTLAQLLTDAELLTSEGLTYASLILFGTHQALGKYLAQSEIIFEYRATEASGAAHVRQDFRKGFFAFYEDLWKLINLRNDHQHYQDGLFTWDIPTFNESAIREAILNAISHRDYRMPGSVFIRQFPRRIEIVSPGGFPLGITLDNILWQQQPRNRRIAESFARCGLVERSGQGMNRIYESCIIESKPKPDFSNTDENHVCITLNGQVQNVKFLQFLEKLGQQLLASFSTRDLLIIDKVFNGEPVADSEKKTILRLRDLGVIEQINRGRGTKYVLAKKFYEFIGKKGVYTRKKGLDRKTNKELLLSHIRSNGKEGSKMAEFYQILPGHTRSQIQVLLRELVKDKLIHVEGSTVAAKWFPVK